MHSTINAGTTIQYQNNKLDDTGDYNSVLVLSDTQGNKLWDTSDELSYGGDVSYGFMDDTGNFALKRSNNDNSVWQSFNYPRHLAA
ncbi:hypothetical protein BVRB_7g163680 [Beta vulgaris subsp. vulgaris]|nr:hypothetical protein BVRB_7g163680 [Beta vulgaris subsp. vulgaris]